MSRGVEPRQEWLSGLDPLDDDEGPALRISPEQGRALVRAVVGARRPGAAARSWPRWARTAAIALMAAATATSAAAAYRGGWRAVWPFAEGAERVAPPPPPAPAAKRPTAVADPDPPAPALAPAPAAAPPEASSASGSDAEPRVVSRPARRRVPSPSAAERPAASEVRESVRESAPRAEVEAAGALARANAARGARRYAEALSLYSSVIDAYPSSAPAQAARVAAADIALEHQRDVARARRLYAEAVKRGGELAAEARFGLAQAERARGDRSAERVALDEFLRHHPSHALGRVARQRRAELER